MSRRLALLRAVNVGGRKLPMADLAALCEGLGWRHVKTYIQSGNVVFEAPGGAAALEAALESAIEARFGFAGPAMIRTAGEWRQLLAANPFGEAAEAEPNRVFLAVPKAALRPDAVPAIAAKAGPGERVEASGGALWFHYADGMGASKITPTLVDRAAGSPTTARNWRTASKLLEMLG